MSSIRQIVRDARRLVRDMFRDHGAWSEPYESEDGDILQSAYLGSLINPSGKYYVLFADGNLEPCPRCKGTGENCSYCRGFCSREALEDDAWVRALESAAARADAWIESGEGDPCDTFLVRRVKEGE